MNNFTKSAGIYTVLFVIFLGSISETSAKLTGATLRFSSGENASPQIQGKLTQVKSGERYITTANEIREILFPDGTALTLGENSEVIVETYEYNESTRTGKMVLHVKKGMVRLVGGVLNNSNTITIKTPTSDVVVNNASVMLKVNAKMTRASLLYGQELKMITEVDSESLVKPEFELLSTSKSESLTGPQRQSSESIAAYMFNLSTRKLITQQAGGKSSSPIENEYSEKGTMIVVLATEEQPEGSINDTANGNDTGGVINLPDRPTPIDDALGSSDGFGVGEILEAANTDGEQATESTSGTRNLTQNRDPISSEGKEDALRQPGPTTNRIFNSIRPG